MSLVLLEVGEGIGIEIGDQNQFIVRREGVSTSSNFFTLSGAIKECHELVKDKEIKEKLSLAKNLVKTRRTANFSEFSYLPGNFQLDETDPHQMIVSFEQESKDGSKIVRKSVNSYFNKVTLERYVFHTLISLNEFLDVDDFIDFMEDKWTS